ncbi:hypothetical protein L1987_58003 [Smallanthus sonchifolius]|uniref:Uncharacterized protein n=1 Tax=Smallanthus sonchifolius TaxID=185202 RepID=A0ACB9DEK2_9ASTR|nr:hypothetical protein L1987_58003 [Smallanthus sonchifolius]
MESKTEPMNREEVEPYLSKNRGGGKLVKGRNAFHRFAGDRPHRRQLKALVSPRQWLHARRNHRLALLPRPRQIRRALAPFHHRQPLRNPT